MPLAILGNRVDTRFDLERDPETNVWFVIDYTTKNSTALPYTTCFDYETSYLWALQIYNRISAE